MSLIARVKIDKFTVTIGQPSPEQFERIMDEYTSYVNFRNSKETDNQTTWENALDTAHWLLASTVKSIKSDDNSFKAEYFND